MRCRFWSFQRKMYAKCVNNQQHEGRALNDDINKIAVVKYSTNCTYLCVSWSWRCNGCLYCLEICDKKKRQPWLVAVYRLLKQLMYCNCWKHIQCEGPAVQCRFWWLQHKIYAKYVNNQQRKGLSVYNVIHKIAVVKSSMNCTYVCAGWSRVCNVARIVGK